MNTKFIKYISSNLTTEINTHDLEMSHECGDKLLFEKLIWKIDEVCQFTTYKKGTIYNLVSNGSIPFRKCGKRLFFVPDEILSWMKGSGNRKGA